MNRFDLKYFCKENNYDYSSARIWLMLRERKFTFYRPIKVTTERRNHFEKVVHQGKMIDFNLESIDNKEKCYHFVEFLIKKETKFLDSVKVSSIPVHGLKEAINKLEIKLDFLNELIKNNSKNNKENLDLNLHHLEKAQLKIQKDALIDKCASQEKNDNEIQSCQSRINDLKKVSEKLFDLLPNQLKEKVQNKKELSHQSIPKKTSEKLTNKIIKQPENKIIPTPQTGLNEKINEVEPSISMNVFSIPWENIKFADGYIYLKLNDKYLEKFHYPKSKKSFNEVKKMYKTRYVPELEVTCSGNYVTKILNTEVLEYYFMFFDNSGSIFKVKSITDIISKYQNFNKAYYRKYFKEIFNTRCFSYLELKASANMPIIPIPERVKNMSGTEYIHDSFLFPIEGINKNRWIWESSSESKATYIFETSATNFKDEIQIIYDFLTGNVNNKRLRLIRGQIDENLIPLKKRIKHNDFNKWKNELESYLNTNRLF